jgi:hypothetical protein|tara:strand:- start:2876 stop:4531 length:1656 start_codon:yes stop_codon:yes gene_type:complete
MKGHKRQKCLNNIQLKYENGNVYEGPTYNNEPSGVGILKMRDGRTYSGLFSDGKRHGYGSEVGNDGYSYSGYWLCDLYNGSGNLKLASGNTYIGYFKNGIFHGKGIYIEKDLNKKYDGQWSSGTRHGQGHEFTRDESYSGYFRYGFRHGHGTATLTSGEIYTGMWKRGSRCGNGSSSSCNGTYVGEWYRNTRHGYGHSVSIFTGEYKGGWYRNTRHGHGTVVYANKTEYTGEWKRGKYSGLGTIKYPDGSSYTGEWLDDERHGTGTLYDGHTVFKGRWEHGQRQGPFEEVSDTGHVNGSYCNDVRHGTFRSDIIGRTLYIWGQQIHINSTQKAQNMVQKMLTSADTMGAEAVCQYMKGVVTWRLLYKYNTKGELLYLLPASENIVRLQKYAWKLFLAGRFDFLEQLVKHASVESSESMLFDSISDEFVANPWMVREQSYSNSSKKKLLKGLHLGECGRCPPKDPFTRLLLTEDSGSYLSENPKRAKAVYRRFTKGISATPSIREIAYSFDMDDFEELLKNAQQAGDRDTIRRLLKERNDFIQKSPTTAVVS